MGDYFERNFFQRQYYAEAKRTIKYNYINGLIDNLFEKENMDYDDILIEAAKNGDVEMIKFALDNGAVDIYFALTSAIDWNKYLAVEFLLARSPENHKLVISSASSQGSTEMVKLAIAYINDDDDKSIIFHDSLYNAIEGEYFDVVNLVLSYNIDQDIKDEMFIKAVKLGNEKIVQIFLEHGVNDVLDKGIRKARKHQHYYIIGIIKEWKNIFVKGASSEPKEDIKSYFIVDDKNLSDGERMLNINALCAQLDEMDLEMFHFRDQKLAIKKQDETV